MNQLQPPRSAELLTPHGGAGDGAARAVAVCVSVRTSTGRQKEPHFFGLNDKRSEGYIFLGRELLHNHSE